MPSAEALAASRANPEVLGVEEVHMRRSIGIARLSAAFASLLLLSNAAGAQLAVSANDGHTAFVNNTTVGSDNPVPDTITVLDLSVSPPKVVGEVQAPTSVVGPPQSVAITRDESIALVTASSKLDPADPKRLVPDNKVTVIDLKSSPPAVLATLEAGLGANGVSINRAGTLALVANRLEGTVSVFSIAGKTVTPAGKVQLRDAKSGPSHVAFTPDGKRALVTRDGDHKVSVLSIDGTKVESAKRDMIVGVRPYSLDVSARGDIAINGNQGGGMGDADTVSVINLKAEPPRVVNTISVGQSPEGVVLSPDGSYLAVNSINGSHKPKDSPFFNDFGLLKIYRVNGTELTFVAQAKVGHWGQGIAWSKDNRTLLYQATAEREIQVLSFDGQELKLTGAIKLSAGPVGIRTAGQ
jgi:DNA-binding beta-propeller fold protein YncE